MVMVEWVGLLLVLWISLCLVQSQHRIEAFFISTKFPTAIYVSSFTKIHVDSRYYQSSVTCSSITDHKHTDSIQTNPPNSTTASTDRNNDSIMHTNLSKAATVPVVTDDGYDDTSNENSKYNIYDDDTDYGDNDLYARSMFGTKSYWDELYIGHGDFPANTYSWYTDWNQLQYYVKQHLPTSSSISSPRIFIPGIGNDSLLIDMISAKYNQKYNIAVQDYSYYALERQIELLQSIDCTQYQYIPLNDTTINNDNNLLKLSSPPMSIQNSNTNMIELYCFDITKRLPSSTKWDKSFHMIIEKGLLDAVYLSDETNSNIQNAIHNLYTILKSNGILISISSVVPNELRKLYFPTSTTTSTSTNTTNQQQPQILWKWIRDGSTDPTKAGCFIFQKLQ